MTRKKNSKRRRQSTRSSRSDLKWLRTFGLVSVFIVFYAVMVFFIWRTFIRFEHQESRTGQGVLILASYPRLLATDDQGDVIITVVNNTKNPITDTTVSLVYPNDTHVSMELDGTNLLRFGQLALDERKTKSVKFQVNSINSGRQKLKIDLELSTKGTTMTNTAATIMTNSLSIEPTITSLLPPIDASKLMLNRTFTVPNFLLSLAAIPASVKLLIEIFKAIREVRDPGSKK